MRKIKLSILIFFAAASICSAQNSYYYSQTAAASVAQTEIASKWEKISFAGSDLNYMFNTENNQTLFNLKWSATNFVLDRTKPLDMVTSDGHTRSFRLTSYEAFSKQQGSGSNIRKIAESTSVSYGGDFSFLASGTQVTTLRFHAEDGSIINIDLNSKNAQKLSASYVSLPQPATNRSRIAAPVAPQYADAQPSCNVCPHAPSPQSETVTCDVHSSNFGDGCLSAKQQPDRPVYYHPENARPYTRAQMGNSRRISATELYSSNSVPASNKRSYASVDADPRVYTRESSSNLNPSTDWKNHISVQSAFGSEVKEAVSPGYSSKNKVNAARSTYYNNPQPATRQSESETLTYYPNSNNISATAPAGVSVDGFWGLQFGALQSDVLDYLLATKRIYRNNVVASSNDEVMLLKNVSMANVVYDNAALMFKEGLSSGLFTKSYQNFQSASSDIELIKSSLKQKYGEPESAIDPSSTRYYWHDNVNMRVIKLEQKVLANKVYGVDLFYVDRALSASDVKSQPALQDYWDDASAIGESDY